MTGKRKPRSKKRIESEVTDGARAGVPAAARTPARPLPPRAAPPRDARPSESWGEPDGGPAAFLSEDAEPAPGLARFTVPELTLAPTIAAATPRVVTDDAPEPVEPVAAPAAPPVAAAARAETEPPREAEPRRVLVAASAGPVDVMEREPAPMESSPYAGSTQGASLWARLVAWRRRRSGSAEPEFRLEDVTPLPPVAAGESVVEVRAIRFPFSFVRVVRTDRTGQCRYETVEPPLDPAAVRTLDFVKSAFLRTLDADLGALDAKGARDYLFEAFDSLAERHRLDFPAIMRTRLAYYLERDFLGFGVIDPMMHDPDVEDISCDGPRVPLFIHHRRFGSVRSNVVVPTDESLDSFVMQLVQRSGKHISVADPLVDATLPDGSRLQASLSREVTTRGSTFTIRRFRDEPFTPPDLVRLNTASDEMMAYFWLAVEHGASALICGGTASGKTTTLNALSLFIPYEKKIVSIEDTREINLPHENWIPGVTRAGGAAESATGKRFGEVDMFDLLKASLRQRPAYLVFGEIRGSEAYALFQAMATGHTVYSTMHADSVASAVYRLESKPLDVPRMMLSALDVVAVQAEVRVGDARERRIREVVELTGIDPETGELLTNRVFSWDPATGRFRYSGASFLLERISEEMNMPVRDVAKEMERRTEFLRRMREGGITELVAVSALLAEYETDPVRAFERLEEAMARGG